MLKAEMFDKENIGGGGEGVTVLAPLYARRNM